MLKLSLFVNNCFATNCISVEFLLWCGSEMILMAIFQVAASTLLFYCHLFCNITFGISGMSLMWTGCPSCDQTDSVKGQKDTQSTDPN